MIWWLLLVPAIAGGAAFVTPWSIPRRAILLLAACAHTGLTAAVWCIGAPSVGDWMAIDATALLFLSITSVLFLAASLYAVGYLAQESKLAKRTDLEEGFLFSNSPEAVFTGCLLLFEASMTLVAVSQYFGLLWVAVEATTLASAPLIYFHRHHRSLEATWKYLLICSVGIALALLGNFFLAVAAHFSGDHHVMMTVKDLAANAAKLDPNWLKAAFLLLLVGYGTKMGLAPLHTWLPDAHSEAPSVVSALMSGALLNCAFLAILRVQAVLAAAGLGQFGRELLVVFGLISMAVAAIFIIQQADYKRMLAYSSVEHMGILTLGIGIGGAATFGAMLHAVNHSLTKAMLFLAAGNILAAYRTKSTAGGTRGLLSSMPVTGILWVAGFLAITGSPPFGLFLSELTILRGAIQQGHQWVAGAYLLLLAIIFIAMAAIAVRMAYDDSPAKAGDDGKNTLPVERKREPLWSLVSPLALCGAVLVLGLYVPPALRDLLAEAAKAVGGNG